MGPACGCRGHCAKFRQKSMPRSNFLGQLVSSVGYDQKRSPTHVARAAPPCNLVSQAGGVGGSDDLLELLMERQTCVICTHLEGDYVVQDDSYRLCREGSMGSAGG